MIGIYISKLRDFSRQLFLESCWDHFLLSEARFVTSFTCTLDGRMPEETAPLCYAPWGQIRPLAFQLIKGKVLPRSFSLRLLYPPDKTKALLSQGPLTGKESDPPLLFINLLYRQEKLLLTTGVGSGTDSFSQLAEISRLWDQEARRFLEELGIPVNSDGLISSP